MWVDKQPHQTMCHHYKTLLSNDYFYDFVLKWMETPISRDGLIQQLKDRYHNKISIVDYEITYPYREITDKQWDIILKSYFNGKNTNRLIEGKKYTEKHLFRWGREIMWDEYINESTDVLPTHKCSVCNKEKLYHNYKINQTTNNRYSNICKQCEVDTYKPIKYKKDEWVNLYGIM